MVKIILWVQKRFRPKRDCFSKIFLGHKCFLDYTFLSQWFFETQIFLGPINFLVQIFSLSKIFFGLHNSVWANIGQNKPTLGWTISDGHLQWKLSQSLILSQSWIEDRVWLGLPICQLSWTKDFDPIEGQKVHNLYPQWLNMPQKECSYQKQHRTKNQKQKC